MKKPAIAIGTLGAIYLLLPVVMGGFDIGSRRGPIIYPESMHREMFIIGCETFRGYKPRERLDTLLYSRALFYGLEERPKGEKEREEIIDRLKRNTRPGSGIVADLESRHKELKEK